MHLATSTPASQKTGSTDKSQDSKITPGSSPLRPALRSVPVRWAAMAVLSCAPLAAQDVCIPDPNLEAAVRAELGRPGGTLTANDLASLRRLVAPNAGIASYAGMEPATNLETLDLRGNANLTSLVLPDEMPRLNELNVSLCGLAHLSLPEQAPALVTLNLEGSYPLPTNIGHLVLPEELPSLETLILRYANIRRLVLLTLPSLRTLDLYGIGLAAVELPPGLRALESLNVAANPLKELRLPPDLVRLRSLDVSDTPVRDYAFLDHLPALEEFITNRDPSLFDEILHPPALTSLTIPYGSSGSLGFLRRFPQLNTLRAPSSAHFGSSESLPSEISGVEELHLRPDLSTGGPRHFVVPPEFVNLRVLNLRQSVLHALTVPAALVRLEHLDLSYSCALELNLPENLPALTTLDLTGADCTERILTIPAGLGTLQSLRLDSSGLADLTSEKEWRTCGSFISRRTISPSSSSRTTCAASSPWMSPATH